MLITPTTHDLPDTLDKAPQIHYAAVNNKLNFD